jgi:translation initiation factor 2 subunit 3
MNTATMSEIMHHAPVVVCGMIGHTADGKSTTSKKLSGKATEQHSKEMEHGSTMKLGYTNVKIFKCAVCPKPKCYKAGPSSVKDLNCEYCDEVMELVQHISLVDCPGHWKLTSTMLSGTCIMDYTILIESIQNKSIPAPQTWEHMVATSVAGIECAVVCLNKIDTLSTGEIRSKIESKVNTLKDFLVKFDYKKEIIPMSAVFGVNINVLCEYLVNLKGKNRNFETYAKMIGIRSFDINKQRQLNKGSDLKGGTLGGSLTQGILKVGDIVKIYPGYTKSVGTDSSRIKLADGTTKNITFNEWKYCPIEAQVISIHSELESLEKAYPGSLIGVQLDIDPALSRNDNLVGNVMVPSEAVHDVKVVDKLELTITYIFPDISTGNPKKLNIEIGEYLKIHVNANEVRGIVNKYRESKKRIVLILDTPIAISETDKIVISDNKSINILGMCKINNYDECKNI